MLYYKARDLLNLKSLPYKQMRLPKRQYNRFCQGDSESLVCCWPLGWYKDEKIGMVRIDTKTEELKLVTLYLGEDFFG